MMSFHRRSYAALRILSAIAGGTVVIPVYCGPTAHAEPSERVLLAGDGTNETPYTATCVRISGTDCTVEFPSRELTGFLANEYVPAYKCPIAYPYLKKKPYHDHWGVAVPSGVEISGLGPIGISITGYSSLVVKSGDTGLHYTKTGTKTGFVQSSATHWQKGIHTYSIILHCTHELGQNIYVRTSSGVEH